MDDKLFNIIFESDDVSWKTLLLELIKSEGMDPWDINVSLLTKKYIDIIKKLREMDFRVTGKVVLAAAILLRIKSNKLVDDDISELDNLLSLTSSQDGLNEEILEEITDNYGNVIGNNDSKSDEPRLIIRTPQPRKRKVSIYDLIDALQQAMEVKKRRVNRDVNEIDDSLLRIPIKKVDITQVIRELFIRVKGYFAGENEKKLMFSMLIPTDGSKEDKVYTFIPLLHLENQLKLELNQEQHFSDFEIKLNKNPPIATPVYEEKQTEAKQKTG